MRHDVELYLSFCPGHTSFELAWFKNHATRSIFVLVTPSRPPARLIIGTV
ncbi:hypothetical protein ACFL4L_02725 [bacterium]